MQCDIPGAPKKVILVHPSVFHLVAIELQPLHVVESHT
jgi:hypothetical protein